MNNEPFLVDEELIEQIEELREIRQKIRNLEIIRDEIMFYISARVESKEYLFNKNGEIIATYKYKKMMRLDSTALKEQLPIIYNHFLMESKSRTFLIK